MGNLSNKISEISDTKMAKTAKKNSIALTLLGAGLGMLAYNAYHGNSTKSYSGNGKNLSKDDSNSALQTVKTTAGNAYESVSETASQAYSTTTNAVGNAYEAVGNAGVQVKDKAQDIGQKAHDTYDYYIEESPLVVGAVALAAGAAVGLAIPSTKFESNLIGDKRDFLVEKANQKVRGFVDQKIEEVKAVAGEAAETALEEGQKAAENTYEQVADEAKDKNLI